MTVPKRKPRTTKAKKKDAQVNKLANAVAKKLDKKKENHYVDQTASAGPPLAYPNATFTHLTPIAIGDLKTQRQGLTCSLKRLLGKIHLENSATAAPANIAEVFRVTLFFWHDTTAPISTDLYPVGTSPTAPVEYQSVIDKKLFVVWDKLVPMTSGQNNKVINIDEKYNTTMHFNGTFGSNISNNQLFLAISAQTAGSDLTGSSWSLGTRVFFKDNE